MESGEIRPLFKVREGNTIWRRVAEEKNNNKKHSGHLLTQGGTPHSVRLRIKEKNVNLYCETLIPFPLIRTDARRL